MLELRAVHKHFAGPTARRSRGRRRLAVGRGRRAGRALRAERVRQVDAAVPRRRHARPTPAACCFDGRDLATLSRRAAARYRRIGARLRVPVLAARAGPVGDRQRRAEADGRAACAGTSAQRASCRCSSGSASRDAPSTAPTQLSTRRAPARRDRARALERPAARARRRADRQPRLAAQPRGAGAARRGAAASAASASLLVTHDPQAPHYARPRRSRCATAGCDARRPGAASGCRAERAVRTRNLRLPLRPAPARAPGARAAGAGRDRGRRRAGVRRAGRQHEPHRLGRASSCTGSSARRSCRSPRATRSGFDERAASAARARAGRARRGAVLERARELSTGRDGRRVPSTLIGVDPSLAELGGRCCASFGSVRSRPARAIALPAPSRARIGVTLGGDRALDVGGRAQPRAGRRVLEPRGIGALADSPIAIAPLALRAAAGGLPGRVSRMLVRRRPAASGQVRAELRAASPRDRLNVARRPTSMRGCCARRAAPERPVDRAVRRDQRARRAAVRVQRDAADVPGAPRASSPTLRNRGLRRPHGRAVLVCSTRSCSASIASAPGCCSATCSRAPPSDGAGLPDVRVRGRQPAHHHARGGRCSRSRAASPRRWSPRLRPLSDLLLARPLDAA